MRCDRARELIDPFVDGELGGEDRKSLPSQKTSICPKAPDHGQIPD